MDKQEKLDLALQLFNLFDTGDRTTTGFTDEEIDIILEALELLCIRLEREI